MNAKTKAQKARIAARVEKEVRQVVSWAKHEFQTFAEKVDEEIKTEVQNQLFRFKKKLDEMIVDADSRLKISVSVFKETVVPEAIEEMRKKFSENEFVDKVLASVANTVEKRVAAGVASAKGDILRLSEEKTKELKNLAPTIFLEFIKSNDFITKVVDKINAMQIKKETQ